MSVVVNCKVAYIRPDYHDLQAWMADDNNVYIGRAGVVFINGERFPKKPSEFCNPFKLNKDGDRTEIIDKYRTYITDRLKAEPKLRKQLKALKGKKLGCWCAPEPCHGDVLLELIEQMIKTLTKKF